jgi:Transketolase, C-terminal domain
MTLDARGRTLRAALAFLRLPPTELDGSAMDSDPPDGVGGGAGEVDLTDHHAYRPGMDRRRFLLTSLAGALAVPRRWCSKTWRCSAPCPRPWSSIPPTASPPTRTSSSPSLHGTVYIRTTRMKTEAVHSRRRGTSRSAARRSCAPAATTSSRSGGAGITLHDALAAADGLARTWVAVHVMDLYCVEPIDCTALLEAARCTGGRLLTVEDHYAAGWSRRLRGGGARRHRGPHPPAGGQRGFAARRPAATPRAPRHRPRRYRPDRRRDPERRRRGLKPRSPQSLLPSRFFAVAVA